jgi:hypothetical protein
MLTSITHLTGLTTDASADNYIPELGAVVDAFVNNNTGPGPNAAPLLLKFDFRKGAKFDQGWNLLCIDLTVNHLVATLNLVPAVLRPTIPPNATIYFRAALTRKMKTFHKFHRQSRPRRRPDGQMEIPAQVTARVTQVRRATNERNKRNGRLAKVWTMSARPINYN